MLLHEHPKYRTKEDIRDIINILKRKSTYQLWHQMVRKVPHYEDMVDQQTFDYYFDGKRTVIDIYKQACFRLKYLYIKNTPFEKYLFLNNWVMTNYIDAIQNDYLKPFLLFINGRCVPWEIINIIFTNEEYYILLETEDEKWNSLFPHALNPVTIILQDGIEYVTGENLEITDQTMFSFNDEGMLDTEHPSVIINNVGKMISTVYYSTPNNFINAEPIIEKTNPLSRYQLQADATIIFRNKLLDRSSVARYDHTLLTVNGGNPGMEGDIFDCRLFVNKHSLKSADNMNRTNPLIVQQYVKDKNLKGRYPSYLDDLDIKFGEQLYAYNNHEIHDKYEDMDHDKEQDDPNVDNIHGTVDKFSKMRYSLMRYSINIDPVNRKPPDPVELFNKMKFSLMRYGVSLDEGTDQPIKGPDIPIDKKNINNKLKFSLLRYGINDKYYSTSGAIEEIVSKAINRYSYLRYSINEGDPNKRSLAGLEMQRWKDYNSNFIGVIDTIINYNMWLFKWIYHVNSNVVIFPVKGKFMLDRMNEDGTFWIPRAHADGIQYCICLVNGELHKYSRSLKYKNNFWIIPIRGIIQEDDDVEMLFFTNIQNDILDMTIDENTDYQFMSEDYINDNMILFARESPNEQFDYPRTGLQHFPVDYIIDEDVEGKKKILVDPFYYSKPLKVAYKNQFRSLHCSIDENTDGAYKVKLNNKFMYCNDYAKYMVFVNGKRISSEHYRLVLPVRDTTPFYEFELYITLPFNKGDKLDIYYLPILMKDVEVCDTLRKDGVIHVRKSRINYPLSRDLYMVWVNGKKVPKNKLMDIDATHIRIIEDIQSTDTVCVTKYIEDFDYLTDFFHKNTSLWTRVMCQLSQEEICLLLNKTPEEIQNIEPSMYENALPILPVMWELIRDQYLSTPYVEAPGEANIYDYVDIDENAVEVSTEDSAGNKLFPVADSHRMDVLDGDRPWP